MDRKQFTFYESFFSAIGRIKKKADRCDAYDALCAYALYGTPPDLDGLPDTAAIAFELIKPNLDSSRKKATSGKKGGSAKQGASKPEADQKQTVSKLEANRKGWEPSREKEKEKEGEIEKENECYPPTPLPPPTQADPVSLVLADYLGRINPMASPSSLDELKGYAEQMGAAVCKRAFDIALDNKKTTWPYIRAILRDKQSRGVRCLADWDAEEAKREGNHGKPERDPVQDGEPKRSWNIRYDVDGADV